MTLIDKLKEMRERMSFALESSVVIEDTDITTLTEAIAAAEDAEKLSALREEIARAANWMEMSGVWRWQRSVDLTLPVRETAQQGDTE